jgi:anti-sigma factor RsiW
VMAGMHPEELELLAYMEGDLDDPRRGQVASHLETCDLCAQELRAVEAGRAALRSAPMLELSQERLDAVLTRLPSRAMTPPGLIRRVLPLAAALAAVAALAGGAFVLGTNGGGDDEGASGVAQDEASDAAGGGEGAATTKKESTVGTQDAPSYLRTAVAGSPASVARRLRRDGFDARAVNGRVIVRGATEADVRKALEQFDPGPVRVLIRP